MRGIVVVDMEVRERDVARGVAALAARGKVVLVVVVAAVHDERGHHDAEHDELHVPSLYSFAKVCRRFFVPSPSESRC